MGQMRLSRAQTATVVSNFLNCACQKMCNAMSHNVIQLSNAQARAIAEGMTGQKKQSMSDAQLFKEAVKEQTAELKKVS
jgi:hypothetical protein